jgi:hypothetical protein
LGRQSLEKPVGLPGVFVIVRNTALAAFIIVSDADIARRAYEIYVERGRADGCDREDWRRAETELKAPAHDSGASAPATVEAR